MLNATSYRTEIPMPVVLAALRPVRWVRAHSREFGLAVILAAAWTLINASGAYGLIRDRETGEILGFVAQVFVETILRTIPIVFVLTWAERLKVKGWRRHLVTVALTSIVLVCTSTIYFLLLPLQPAGLAYGITASPLALLLYAIWISCVLALLTRSYIAQSNEEQAAKGRLLQIRNEQIAARRRLIEARLAAIQARIDPQFFFDMLNAVQRAYEVDVEKAELLLDELIVFLRAALPRLRTASSTVAQECEMAKSYARLRTLCGSGSTEIDSVIPEALETAPFPPGVLLPLVEAVLREAPTEHALLLTADRVADRIVLFLASSARPSHDAVARVETTLAELFGERAELVISSSPDRAILTTVRVPL